MTGDSDSFGVVDMLESYSSKLWHRRVAGGREGGRTKMAVMCS